MTKERIRIVMAEACGWNDINLYEDNHGPSFWSGYPPAIVGADKNNEWQSIKAEHHKPLPNYPDDLNAVHEAEKTLDINSLSRYADELEKVCVPVHICPLTHWQSVIMATALQRCEAFIKTVCPEKWEEDR